MNSTQRVRNIQLFNGVYIFLFWDSWARNPAEITWSKCFYCVRRGQSLHLSWVIPGCQARQRRNGWDPLLLRLCELKPELTVSLPTGGGGPSRAAAGRRGRRPGLVTSPSPAASNRIRTWRYFCLFLGHSGLYLGGRALGCDPGGTLPTGSGHARRSWSHWHILVLWFWVTELEAVTHCDWQDEGLPRPGHAGPSANRVLVIWWLFGQIII